MKNLVVYCFLGFGGKRGEWYSGFSDLIKLIQDNGIDTRIFEFPEHEVAVKTHQAYDHDRPTAAIGHSYGADAAKLFCHRCPDKQEYFASIDLIPRHPIKNVQSFFGHLRSRFRLKPLSFYSFVCKEVANFYQRQFNLFSYRTWPQGRLLVNERGEYWSNTLIKGPDHCKIDSDPYVHECILHSLLDIAGRLQLPQSQRPSQE